MNRLAGHIATALLVSLPVLAPSYTAAQAVSGEVVLEETADYRCAYPAPASFVDVVKGHGTIPLVLPDTDGPVQGKGTFTHQGTGYRFAGPLILEGQVRGGILSFPFPKGYSGGQQVYNRNDTISIRTQKDAVTILDMTSNDHGVDCSGSITWRLGKPLERWRITIEDEGNNVALTGSADFDHAGLIVRVRRVVEVTIERGKFKNGTGTSRFLKMKPYSKPPGIYACKPATMNIVGTGSDIDFERLDQTKWASRFNPPKTPADAALKAQWEKLKKQKTPVIYPETYSVTGQISGRALNLKLPADSGYTIGVYCRLALPVNDPRSASKRREHIATQRSALIRSLSVQLVDRWHYEESWSRQHPGLRTTSGTTTVDVTFVR